MLRGFRYRLNHKRLPGHPDLVLRKYRTCIFVNGCFWHGHHVNLQFDDSQFTIENSECCKIPKTNHEFWVAKIRRNKERDKEEQRKLARLMGYQKYWNFERLMDKVATFLQQEKGLDLKEHMDHLLISL